eukprot:PhM_4_TR9462/c0_g1_i2/m.22165/K17290/HTATIP2; oxidoreductase
MSESVIIAGATGAIGRHVVSEFVARPEVSRVVALSRSFIAPEQYPAVFPGVDVALAATKLHVQQIDWEALWKADDSTLVDEALRQSLTGHTIAVMAMGTTRRDAGSAAMFRHVDYDYVTLFLRLVLTKFSAASCRHLAQVSSGAANSKSCPTAKLFLEMVRSMRFVSAPNK